MKNIFFLIPILGIMYSCSGETKQTEKKAEELHKQIEVLEKSTEKFDTTVRFSEFEMEKSQSKIDSLLHNI